LTYYGVGTLAFIDGNMNSQKYIQTLDINIWPVVTKHFGSNTWYFQDDNAPCHRSRESEDWKHRNQIPQISWPPQSPDLSPIKNIWLLLKNKIKNRLFLIRNLADLKTQLMTAWNEVPLFYIQKLYASLPQRCREVLIQKGTITKY
jgi:transposase